MMRVLATTGLSLACALSAVGADYIYFSATDATNGREPWVVLPSDPGSARLLANVNPNDPLSFSSDPDCFTSLGTKVLFRATRMQLGRHLWVTDGTTVSPLLIGNASVIDPVYTFNRIAYNGKLLFTATDGVYGVELWITDGTQSGTTRLKDIYPNAGSSNPANFIIYNNIVYFTASDGATGIELWRTDGTTAGTRLVQDLYIAQNSADPAELTVCGGKLFFSANSAYGRELFVTDGTTISLTKDIYIAQNSSGPVNLCAVGSTLYFSALEYGYGRELWKSNGTEAGTVRVKDINATYGFGSDPQYLTNVNGLLYFSANDGVKGRELWRSNGTEAGTILIRDQNNGSASSNPAWLKAFGNAVVYVATATGNSRYLFSYGTTGGQSSVEPVSPFISFKGLAWASTKPGIGAGAEPMGFNPDTAAPYSWGDIVPGSNGSNPDNFVNASEVYLYLAATNASGVRQVYRTNGSWGSAGMVLVPSAANNPAYSGASNLFCHHQ
jgi:ELWxxDGT repeat protein